MNSKPSYLTKIIGRFESMHGLILALPSAVLSEALFFPFQEAHDYLAGLGRLLFVSLSIYILHRYAYTAFRHYKPVSKDLANLSLVLLGSILIIWFGEVVSISVSKYSASSEFIATIKVDSLFFAIPYTTGGLLLQAIFGLHYSLVLTTCLTLIVGVYFPHNHLLIPYVFATNLVACLSLSRFRSRYAFFKCGFNVALLSIVFVLAASFIDHDLVAADVGVRLVSAVAGGILASFIAAGFVPVLEYLGGYVTDMRLIEMATLDHELLKELSIQAPGTWNHSMVMGMMVESAANAIGANSVVARVGAYFHDIGKMKKPLYFVENQTPGENRHDKLSPSMSALIIRSHVKDGIELARKHKLPEIIEDMIPQHHGTSLIEYFYDKACTEAEEAGKDGEVDPSHYTYPGPKPQTKEAGILMLADGIEAATRTLSDPTLDRIQGLVQKMINKVFASGELDECEITLKDLHLIAKSFTRVLTGIYHQRIAYAEPAEKINEKVQSKASEEEIAASEKDVAGTNSNKKPKPQFEEKQSKEDNKEDLKRLGL